MPGYHFIPHANGAWFEELGFIVPLCFLKFVSEGAAMYHEL
jgi:hypothetical protein